MQVAGWRIVKTSSPISAAKFGLDAPSILLQRRVSPPGTLFLRKRKWSDWLFVLSLIIYAAFCIFIYFHYVVPWINGDTQIRIGADSDRYWDYAKLTDESGGAPLFNLTGNFLGPVLMIRVLKTGFAIMCFNFVVFAIALKIVASIPGVNKTLVGFLFLANAELLPALTTLNKEIFALLGGVLTAKYLYAEKRSRFLLLMILAVSMFARWEQTAIFLLFLAFERLLFRGKPWLGIFTLVAAVTVMYPFIFRILNIDPHIFDGLMVDATTQIRIDDIQRAFGFPLVVVPKILMLLTGQLHSPSFYEPAHWWKWFVTDPQNWLFLPLGCLMYSIVFGIAVWTGRMKLTRPVALLSVLTLIISAVPPFTQPRYIYLMYTMLCIDIARPTEFPPTFAVRKSRKWSFLRPIPSRVYPREGGSGL
jgi:hypothetical protein